MHYAYNERSLNTRGVPMFAALVGWYTGCERNRRRYPRVKRDFIIEYTLDGNHWEVAEGVDLSGGGLCMVSFRNILQDAFEARIEIGERTISLHLRKVWGTTTEHRGKQVPFYGLQFDRIESKDWELVMQSITGRSSPPAERFEPVPIDETDVNRLLPPEFRERLTRELKIRSRIDPQKPQLAFEYGGIVYEKSRRMHQFTVRSTVNNYAGLKRYTTKILVNDEDSEVVFVS